MAAELLGICLQMSSTSVSQSPDTNTMSAFGKCFFERTLSACIFSGLLSQKTYLSNGLVTPSANIGEPHMNFSVSRTCDSPEPE